MDKKPLIINCLGEPGAGKSTMASRIYYMLKCKGFNVEYLQEFAKQKLYENVDKVFSCEPYIFGKQLYRLMSVSDNVDIVVTDSPIILPPFYEKDENKRKILFDLALEYFKDFNNLNILIQRKHDYDENGRFQNEEQANVIYHSILKFLTDKSINTYVFQSTISDTDLYRWLDEQLTLELSFAERS